MSRVASFTRQRVLPLWRWYFWGFLMLAGTNFITLRIPQMAKTVVNALAANQDLSAFRNVAIAIVGLGVMQMIIRTLSRILIFWPGRTIEAVQKNDLFSHIIRSQHAFFLSRPLGDLVSRLANDVQHIRIFFGFGILQTANLIFLICFTIAQMFHTHIVLSILCLLPLALMLAITRLTMPRLQELSRRAQEIMARLTSTVTEAFASVHVIQATSSEAFFLDRAAKDNASLYDINIQLLKWRTIVFPLMSTMASFSQLIVLFYGGHLVISKSITVGDILAFNVYLGFLMFPLSALGIILALYERVKTSTERVAEIEAAPLEIQPVQNLIQDVLPVQTGALTSASSIPEIAISNLNFSYPDARESGRERPPSVHGLSIEIARGSRVAFVGPIGSGKSTVFKLLTRILDPAPGSIAVRRGGRLVDVLEWSPHDLRSHIAYAEQEAHLFSASIEDNIRFGLAPDTPLEALAEAARKAAVLDEILSFPAGWQTQIGENGIRLSGGQKQRLALARIFLRAPSVVVLDDVLAAVDQRTERTLIASIDALKCTVILASHRHGILESCDQVVLLQRGSVVASGPFKTLLKQYPEMFAEGFNDGQQ